MRPRSTGCSGEILVVVGLIALLIVLAPFALPGLSRPAQGTSERPGALATDRVASHSTPQNCSETLLATLTATPAKVAATPLEVLMFSAVAKNACGAPLASGTNFSWWLSSVALGTLNSSAGSTVAYTACIAPMGGVLHVKASSGAVTLFANSSISVSAQASSGSSPPSPSGGGASGGPTVSWVGLGVMAALLGAAAAVLLAGRRKRR
ncbi:MAG: hypothetical protein WB788_02285 [Thermoplasmata archaeon]